MTKARFETVDRRERLDAVVNVRVTATERRILERDAQRLKRPVSDVVRRALAAWFERPARARK